MATIIEIETLDQTELDVFVRLTEPQLRNRKGVFIAESPNVIERGLLAGYRPISMLMERKYTTGKGADIMGKCGDIPAYTGDSDLLKTLTGYALTRGILCAMERQPLPTIEAVCHGAKRIAVLHNVTDSTNIGAIFRSAAALHIDGVLVTTSCCDPLCRRSLRVSMGTVFQVPWTYVEGERYPNLLKTLGFKTVAMALSDTAVSIDDAQLMAEPRLAIVMGAEGDGLPKTTIAQCDYTACIPMSHGVDSLNVAAASAVAFWQLKKLRTKSEE